MSIFKPFRRQTNEFRASGGAVATPQQPSESEVSPQGSAPAGNRETTPTPTPQRAASPDAEANFAHEAEQHKQAELSAKWTQAIDTLNVANRMVEALVDTRKESLAQVAPLIADIVRTMVEHLTAGALKVNDEVLMQVVQQAAEALPEDAVRIRVCPADVERVKHLLPDTLGKVIEADESVESGCIAETQRATVDASLKATRDAIEDVLDTWFKSDDT